MTKIAIQISPEARSAYFADFIHVAQQELIQVFGNISFEHINIGPLDYFIVDSDTSNLDPLTRLSFAQGLYELEGDLFRPLNVQPDFNLHDDFVFGSKFKGKTNERLTQMLINVGLAEIATDTCKNVKLLDPMCGRGTTLLWAMRYGINARGIEQDANALPDIQRNLKKWTHLHRQKHKLSDGFIGPANKKSLGKFLDFSACDCTMRVVTGDAREADRIYKKEKFDLVVCDLPYGIQHFTTDKTRNPLSVIEQCVAPWKNCMKKNSALVLSFNSNNPKRAALIQLFENSGFAASDFSAKHRMSESIVRDVIILRPDNAG